MLGGAEKSTAPCSRTCPANLSASCPPSFSVLRVILPSEVGGEHQLSLLSDSFCRCFPADLDMRTTGMCVLLVCLCTVSPGQSTNGSQDVEGLSEKSEYETAAGDLPRIRAASANTDDSSSSLSLGKIGFLSLSDFPLQKLTESFEDKSVTWPGAKTCICNFLMCIIHKRASF